MSADLPLTCPECGLSVTPEVLQDARGNYRRTALIHPDGTAKCPPTLWEAFTPQGGRAHAAELNPTWVPVPARCGIIVRVPPDYRGRREFSVVGADNCRRCEAAVMAEREA